MFAPLIAKLPKTVNNALSVRETTQLFAGSFTHRYFPGYTINYLVDKKNNQNWLSPVGAILLLDLLKNKDKWDKININFDQLQKNYFGAFYHKVKGIYSLIEHDEPKLQILKIFLYCNFNTKKNFPVICGLIDNNKDYFLKNTHFIKLTNKIVTEQNLDVMKPSINRIYFSNDYDENCNLDFDLRKMVRDIAKLNGIAKENYNDFSHSILNLHFNLTETLAYIKLRKQEISPQNAAFLTQPTLYRWVKANIGKSLLIVPLLYGCYVTYQTKKSKAQVMAPTAPAPTTAIILPPPATVKLSSKQQEQSLQAQSTSQPQMQTQSVVQNSIFSDSSLLAEKSEGPPKPDTGPALRQNSKGVIKTL